MHKDLALVTSGGGMTCAYSAGAILALKDLGITKPGWAIGSSGSTGSLAYYVAEQYQSIVNIWQKLTTVKEFVDIRRLHRITDVDYLIDEIFKKQDPLNIEAIRRSPTELLIATTNCETGKIRYFSNREAVCIFEALRASKAMPFFYGKKVKIGGELYFDGAIAGSVAVNIQEAIDRGAKRIIAINNSPHGPLWGITNQIASVLLPHNVAKSMRKASLSPRNIRAGGVKIIHIKPSKKPSVSLLDNNPENIQATINIGYRDVTDNLELKEFI